MTSIIIIYLIVLYYIFKNRPVEIAKKKYIFFTSFVLILISGLRNEAVGSDTYAYIMHFEDTLEMSWSDVFDNFVENYINPLGNGEKDPVYRVCVKLFGSILPDSRLYLFLVAFILLASIGYFLYTFASDLKSIQFCYVFYVALFYGYLPNSAIRQSLALALILIAYCLLHKGKTLESLLLILLASGFHKSALLCLLFVVIVRFKNVKLVYLLSILLFVLMLMFPTHVALLFADSSEIYSGYVSNSYYGNTSKPYMVVFLFIVLFLISVYSLRDVARLENHRFFYYGTALTVIFVPLVWVNPTLLRIVSYFGLWMGLLIPLSLKNMSNGKLILTLVTAVFFIHSLKSIDNYRFMWQYMKLHERYAYVMPKWDNCDVTNKNDICLSQPYICVS